jgi:hypothetical protein
MRIQSLCSSAKAALAALLPLTLLGCAGGRTRLPPTGITVTRSPARRWRSRPRPATSPSSRPENARNAEAIDVVAHITNLRTTCDESGDNIVTNVTFELRAQRRAAASAREVVLPYFAVVVQGGTNVVSKSVSRLVLNFPAGQLRASTTGTASGLGEPRRRHLAGGRSPPDHP